MNKGSFLNSRKFRHGSTAAILTAFVIAVVVIINIIFVVEALEVLGLDVLTGIGNTEIQVDLGSKPIWSGEVDVVVL